MQSHLNVHHSSPTRQNERQQTPLHQILTEGKTAALICTTLLVNADCSIHVASMVANDAQDPVFLQTVASVPVALVTGVSLVHDGCSIHVASVVQMTHMILCHGGVMKSGAMDRVQQMSSYWSALVHDYEHGGLNNDFLIKSNHPLAMTYKYGISVYRTVYLLFFAILITFCVYRTACFSV